MEHKLTNITKSFHSFAKDQVLTEKQLNEFLNYFDEQDRLSRICLSGVGIVCGFEVSTNETTKHISISKGAGVTTDGDLVHLLRSFSDNNLTARVAFSDGVTCTHFRAYSGEKVSYDPQFDSSDGAPFTQIPLLELVPAGESTIGDSELRTLASLETKVVLIYIESYAKDRDNCVGIDCENQGIEQVNKLRFLLIDQSDINRLTRHDNIFSAQSAIDLYLDRANVHVPRVILNKTNSANATLLADSYSSLKLNSATRALSAGLSLFLRDSRFSIIRNNILTTINSVFNSNYDNLIYFQYRYDFLKDLVDSYNELKSAFLNRSNFCCPNINAFPKHLMLGSPFAKKLKEQNSSYMNQYRHSFYKSPIFENNNLDDEFAFIAKRMEELCLNFRKRSYFDSDLLKITPSNVGVPLGNRAIPFYYNFSTNLMKNWDFQRRKYDQHQSILGYSQAINSPLNPAIATPFNFSVDAYNFYRIEGHQGLLYNNALKLILEEKNKYSLPFDVKILGISVVELDALFSDQYKCTYRDLEVLLKAWSSELECISSEVTKILSSFSIKQEGRNLVEEKYYDIVKNPRVVANPILPEADFDAQSTLLFDGSSVPTEQSFGNKSTSPTDGLKILNSSNRSTFPAPKQVKFNDKVEQQISTDADSIGSLIKESLIIANGNYTEAVAIALINSDKAIVGWEQEIAVSTVTLPMKIILSLTRLGSLIPDGIQNLSETTFDEYNAEIAKLCSYTKQMQGKYRSTNESFLTKISKDTRGMVALLINQLTTICCSSRKLQSLLAEVESRKESILNRLDFTKFIAQNPGLEHKAGVGPGHTFVLVYVNSDINIRNRDIIIREERSESMEFASRRQAYLQIPKGTIIADFTLPYMCCSDCETVNFVLPKTPVELSLPVDAYCIDDSNLELEFTVLPEDGKITVDESVPGVSIDGKILRIDGSFFPSDRLGTKLKFKVDGERANLELLVSKRPSVELGVALTDPGSRLVIFSTDGEDRSSFTYLWNFGDGATSTERNPTHQYALSQTKDTFDVTLTVSADAGICPAIETTTLNFEGVTISIDPGPYCENSEPVNISISPEGANPEIVGPGITEDFKQFDPKIAGVGTHEIFYQSAIIQTITVNPVAQINGSVELNVFEGALHLNVSASNASLYSWKVKLPNKQILEFSIAQPVIPLATFDEFAAGSKIEIEVIVQNDCGEDTREISYIIPNQAVPTVTIPNRKFCKSEDNQVFFEVENFTSTTTLELDGIPINTKPPFFIPAALSAGTHTISINNIEQFTINIGEAPMGSILGAMDENSFLFSFDQDSNNPILSSVWNFFEEGNEESGEIRASIEGSLSIQVPFVSLESRKWKKLIVYLSLTNKCGETKISTVVNAPTQSVIVTLPNDTYTYCSKDDTFYSFIFSPENAETIVTGDGVDNNKFNPYNLAEGVHEILVSNGPSIFVTIADPSYGNPEAPSYNAQEKTLALKFTPKPSAPNFNLQWTIYRKTRGDIPNATSNSFNYIALLNELAIEEGEEIKIDVNYIVTGCGEVTNSMSFIIPISIMSDEAAPAIDLKIGEKSGPQSIDETDPFIQTKEFNACTLIITDKFKELKKTWSIRSFTYPLKSMKDVKTTLDSIFNLCIESPEMAASGKLNVSIFKDLSLMLETIYPGMQNARDKNFKHYREWINLYKLVMQTLVNVLRCQTNVSEGEELVSLLTQLRVHFNMENTTSFPNLGTNIFMKGRENELAALLEEPDAKDPKTKKRNVIQEPWSTLDFIYQNELKLW